MIKVDLLLSQRCKHGLVRLKKFTSISGEIHYKVLIWRPNGSLNDYRFYNYDEALLFYKKLVPNKRNNNQSYFNL